MYTICMKSKLTKARTCVYNINYHIVWTVKYRRKILIGDVEQYLKDELQKIAEEKDFIIHAMECDKDHIHLFVSAHPKIAPSYIVKMCKGITGRKLFLQFPDISKKLWKNTLWNSSFYIETIGSTNEENIKRYIENQKMKGEYCCVIDEKDYI